MNHGRSRLRVVAVLSALGAVAAGGITVMSCEPDHNRDVPGAPKIISAYVTDLKLGGSCDGTDPRSFGGGFTVHDDPNDPTKARNVRCYPDLLANPPDPMVGDVGPFSYAVQIRVVFSEGLNGDLLEDQDNVKLISTFHDGVVSGMSMGGVSATVPANRQPLMSGELTTYWDPAGADFKQGIYGTAPPGPAIVLTPGNTEADGTVTLFGLPSGSMTTFTMSGDKVKDTAGNSVDPAHNSITIATLPFGPDPNTPLITTTGDNMPAITDVIADGIGLGFNAPMNNSDIMAGTWLTVTYMFTGACGGLPTSGTLPPTFYTLEGSNDGSDPTVPTTGALVATLKLTMAAQTALGSCPSTTFPITVTLTAKAGMTKDQYGSPLMTDSAQMVLIQAPPASDAGAF